MHEWSSDVIHAWRRLRAAPSFALFSVLTLALGIGATTAIYSVVYAAVLRPPDIRDIDRVANLYHADPRRGSGLSFISLSHADFEDYRAVQTSFEFLAAWQAFRLPLAADGSAEWLMGEAVGGQYFSVVGVQPALGRVIQPSDDTPKAPRVLVLSDGLWKRRFGGDPAVVGRVVKLGAQTFEIIGVAPPAFRGVSMPNVLPTAGWIPLAAAPVSSPDDLTDRERRTVLAKGRLRPGTSMDEARAELRTIAHRLDLAFPIGLNLDARFKAPPNVSRPWVLLPAASVKMHESVDRVARPLAATIMLAVGLVLLVACTNVANLVLARGTARRHETAVRLALGATRWRLVREQITEASLLALAGSAAALVVARILMARVLSGELRLAPALSVDFAPSMNASVAFAAAASTAIALIVFGIVPAIHGSQGSLRDAIASDGHNPPLPRWRGRRGLIACQVAVSAGLVSVAVLCAQQLIALARHDTGIDVDRLAIVRVPLQQPRYDEGLGRRVVQDILESARQLPNVESVAVSSGFPIELGGGGGGVGVSPDQLNRGYYDFVVSTPEVFGTWGVQILEGRRFDDRDTAASERVVILTGRLARELFSNGAAVGRQIFIRFRQPAGEPLPPVETVTVIGIAADTDVGDVGNRGGGFLYLPWSQHYRPALTITARTTGDPASLIDPLKRVVNRADSDLAVMDAVPAAALGGGRSLVLKVGAAASGLLGWLSLILAMAGLYGVLSELVLRRTRELGIRMALGADARRLLGMVLLDGARPVVAGLAIGLGFGIVLRVGFRPLFIRMLPAFDPLIVSLVPAAFIVAALIAAYVPARRASRVDPNVALRHL